MYTYFISFFTLLYTREVTLTSIKKTRKKESMLIKWRGIISLSFIINALLRSLYFWPIPFPNLKQCVAQGGCIVDTVSFPLWSAMF